MGAHNKTPIDRFHPGKRGYTDQAVMPGMKSLQRMLPEASREASRGAALDRRPIICHRCTHVPHRSIGYLVECELGYHCSRPTACDRRRREWKVIETQHCEVMH